MFSFAPLPLLAAATFYVVGVLRLLIGMAEAPMGYEDEDGFHYGLDSKRGKR